MSSGGNGYPGVSADSEQCPWCFEFLNGPRKGENPGRKMGLRAQGTDRYYETGKEFTAGEGRAPKKGLYSEGGEELSHGICEPCYDGMIEQMRRRHRP